MAGLLIKDYYLLTQRKQTFLVFLLVSILMGYTMDGSFIVGYMSVLGMILAVGTFSYDEADNGLLFLMTLPISRRSYVLSKYLLGAVVCGVSWVLAVVLMFVMNAVKGLPMDFEENLLASLAMLPVGVLGLDMMLPVQLKFGLERSRLVLTIVGGGAVAIGLLMSRGLGDKIDLSALVAALDRIPGGVVAVVLAALCVAITAVSMAISVKVMENKTV